MTTVTKMRPTGTIPFQDAGRLKIELVSKSPILGAVCTDVTVDGGEVDDTLIFDFDTEPDDTALESAIDAYPSVLDGATGTFAVTAGTEYVLKEEPIGEGESVAFDVHVHAALGTAAGYSSAFIDWYVIADRFVGGDVQISRGSGVSEGSLPGARIVPTKTATTARISIVVQRNGTLTIIGNDITIESRGTVPA